MNGGRFFYAGLMTAFLAPVAAYAQPAEPSTAVPTSGIIDLAQWFPGQMAKTHYLAGSQPGTDWHLTNIGGDHFAFRLGTPNGDRGDLYVVFEHEIAVLGHAFDWDGQLTIVSYLPPYPSFPRYLDVSELPLERVHPSATAAVQVGATEPYIQHHAEGRVTISHLGNAIELRWWDPNGPGFEALTIGAVPIAGTDGLTTPGLTRYETHLVGGINTHFTWTPR